MRTLLILACFMLAPALTVNGLKTSGAGGATTDYTPGIPDSAINPSRNYYLNIGGTGWNGNNNSVWNSTQKVGANFINGYVLIMSTWFGSYPCLHCASPGQSPWCNGGIPQLANLSHHIETIKGDLTEWLPGLGIDRMTFDGVLVNDYEAWIPLYDEISPEYKEASMNYTMWKYPHLAKNLTSENLAILESLSRSEFEAAGLQFMVITIRTLKTLFPKAAGFGFYGYPSIFTYWDFNRTKMILNNDQLMPLWEEVTAFYPSLYLPYKSENKGRGRHLMNKQWIARHMVESQRLAEKFSHTGGKRILPYTWYRYHDGEPHGLDLLDSYDTYLEFDYPYSTEFPQFRSGNFSSPSYVDGIIIWGSESLAKNGTAAENYFVQNKATFTSAKPPNPYPSGLVAGMQTLEKKALSAAVRSPSYDPNWAPPQWKGCSL